MDALTEQWIKTELVKHADVDPVHRLPIDTCLQIINSIGEGATDTEILTRFELSQDEYDGIIRLYKKALHLRTLDRAKARRASKACSGGADFRSWRIGQRNSDIYDSCFGVWSSWAPEKLARRSNSCDVSTVQDGYTEDSKAYFASVPGYRERLELVKKLEPQLSKPYGSALWNYIPVRDCPDSFDNGIGLQSANKKVSEIARRFIHNELWVHRWDVMLDATREANKTSDAVQQEDFMRLVHMMYEYIEAEKQRTPVKWVPPAYPGSANFSSRVEQDRKHKDSFPER